MRAAAALLVSVAAIAAAGSGGVLVAVAAGPSAVPLAAHAPPTTRRRIEAVVRAWSARLNAGDYRGIARLFSVPVVVTQGSYAYRLKTAKQVAIWHAALPCGGKIVAIKVEGPFATATFQLANRRGSKCDAPGSLAAARFTVIGGKITDWRQVAVPQTSGPVA